MSAKTFVLALRLEGPMQSWGNNSQFNRRNTLLFPTKSALAGICCAAMGCPRGSEEEKDALEKIAALKLLCIAVPLRIKNKMVMVKRMQDYHTVMGTRDAKGKVKSNAVLTYRQYLNDARFISLLEGERSFLLILAKNLQNPKWGVWLGRKACIPSAPVFVPKSKNEKLFNSEAEAVSVLLGGRKIESFTHLREVDSFGSGIDSYMDQAISFEVDVRKFVPRRVILNEAKISVD